VQVASKKFRNIFQLIEKEYVDSIKINDLFEKGIAGILKELDPHSSYVSNRDILTKTNLDSQISGIGIKYSFLRDTLFITEVIKDGPAHKSGVMAGDRILKVDDQNIVKVEDQSIFSNLIRGKKGTNVNLSIYRKFNNSTQNIKIERNDIPYEAIDLSYMIDKQTGYIKLNRFSDNSGNELHSQLIQLKKQGLKQLILDLRGNGGGYFDAAVQICDEFLPQGKDIVYTQSRGIVKDKKKSQFYGEFEHQKLIVLIDENSASSSEIVSAALQDNDRAIIIGRRSFGKGLVQSPFLLFDGSEVRITTSRYYSPSGRCLQKPYTEYNNDISNRLQSGQLSNKDSIYKNDSLKYHTNNMRTVYGGGGVYPDIFIPLDTSLNEKHLVNMLTQQLFLEFGVLYFHKHPELQKMSLEEFSNTFIVTDKHLDDFLDFCEDYKIEPKKHHLTPIKWLLKRELKIYLAEVIWGTNGMYRLINLNDQYIIQSLKAFPKSKEILEPQMKN
jgi:carboxyl-terminal processing protease